MAADQTSDLLVLCCYAALLDCFSASEVYQCVCVSLCVLFSSGVFAARLAGAAGGFAFGMVAAAAAASVPLISCPTLAAPPNHLP